jgi:LuxR family maltose regulon positive regulatory protein
LLETKLYIPRWRPGLVARPRLLERLERGAEGKLTLVSAPAGFGKTTLVSEWLAARERPVAWLSLDAADSDPARFLAYLVAALQTAVPTLGGGAVDAIVAAQARPAESILTSLLNEIALLPDPLVLVLDDLHVIDARPIDLALTFLLDHLPPTLRLVITTREDPRLPLARLRARGELTELRAAELRFTTHEAAGFLNEVMGLALAPTDVAALEARTEGWVAGLQLAALSMQGRQDIPAFIEAFAGDDRYIVDYLTEEVLLRQPERVRTFLLQTSILDRLSGALCDAVTGRDDGTQTLAALERGNLFVVPLDDKRLWYRYHHLFADVLRARAMEEHADLIPTLRRRAAAWLEAHGVAVEAIEQARAAGDHDAVARLLTANFEEFARLGRYASISRWAASLPEAMVRERPRLALICATSALVSDNNLRAARAFTAWAEDAINAIAERGALDPSGDVHGTVVGAEGLEALKSEVLVLKLLHSARTLPATEIAAMAGQALASLPPSRHHIRGMLLMVDAGIQATVDDLPAGLSRLERVVDEARRTRDPLLLAGVLTRRGQMCVAMGRLEDGLHAFGEAIFAGQDASPEANPVMCEPHTGLAEVLLERGDLSGAAAHAAQALAFASASPTRSPVLYAWTTAAQVMQVAGDLPAAQEHLAQAQGFARGVEQFRFASFLGSVLLRVHCRTGDLEAAADVVRERGLSPDVTVDDANEEEMTAYARYLVTRGDCGDALRVLSGVLPIVRARGRVQHEIHALVLQAAAHEALAERALALESLGRATMLGEPGRFNRTFTGEIPVVTGLVEALADAVRRGRGPAEAGSPAYLAWLLREARARPETTVARSAAAGLAEPLTPREVEILRLVTAGLRNAEIAERLFISLPTVKRHIANTYGKLGVDHRTAAIARANELDVL